MTTERHLERDLPAILGDLAMGPYPDYIDDVLVATAQRRQRPVWTFPERWLPMEITTRSAGVPSLPWRQLGVLALIAILLSVAVATYVGSQRQLPAPFGPAANGLIPYERNGDIYLGDPVSRTSQLVVGGDGTDMGPSYAADGSMIGFLRKAGQTQFDVYVVRPDGGGLRRLTPTPITDQSWVQWAPDSRHIATIRPAKSSADGCIRACVVSQLDLIDVSSGEVRTIAQADGMDYVKFRPPDAGELLYRARVDGKWGLFAMDPDGTNVRELAAPTVPGEMDMTYAFATYSADGSRIFYEHGGEDGCCQLWVMNADGTDPHEFRPLGPAWDGQALPSPDGTMVAYWHNANDGAEHGIFVARTDGTGEVIETGPDLPGGAEWVWAPDSSKILMFPNDVSSGSAYLLDPEGGPWTTLPWVSGPGVDWQRVAPAS